MLAHDESVGSPAIGYLSEEAEMGSLENILPHISLCVSYREFLTAMLNVAEAIQFLHERKFVHRDVTTDNVLVFSNKEGISMKLTDLGNCCTFEQQEAEDEYGLGRTRKEMLAIHPELEAQNGLWETILVRKDWIGFANLLTRIIQHRKFYPNASCSKIRHLIEVLSSNDYWQQGDTLKFVKKCFEDEFKASQAKWSTKYRRNFSVEE